MPNRRSKTKRYLGGFVDKGLNRMIIRGAKRAGMKDNKSGFMTQLLQEALELRKRGRGRRGKG